MRSRVGAYATAIAALAAALVVRWLLDPVMGETLPLVTVFGAIAAVVWLGGYGPAILVTVLGYVACAYLFIEPRGMLGLDRPENVIGLVAYLLTSAVIIVFGEVAAAAQARASARGELLRVTLSSIGDAVVTTDVDGHVTYLNGVAESLTGWTAPEARGRPLDHVFRIVNEETRDAVANPATRALREGVVVGLANHTLLIRRDGTEIAIDDSAAPISDEHGMVAGCVLIFRDVTEQRRLAREKAAQLHTARTLAAIVESSDDAIVGKTLDGIIQSWNAGAERIFGHTAEQAIGQHISLIIPPERLAEEHDIIARLRAGGRIDHFETERLRRDGERIAASLTISPVRDAAGNIIGASKVARDVTERRRAEAERERLVTVIENVTDFIGISDLEGMPFFVNRAGLALVGLDGVEQARAMHLREFFFPEDQPKVLDEFLPRVLREGHGEIEIRFRHFRTGAARWMAYKVITLKDATGRPTAFATVSHDVTERKRMEDDLRSLAAALSEADRRKDEFLAMLAHELRNPLAPISNAVRVLRRGGDDEETVHSASEVLERQVGQMARLVDDLLDVSRITRGRIELRQERIELEPVVNQAVEASRALYRSMGHQLTVSLPPEPIHLEADPARLAQVVGNLLNNACKFTDPGGDIRLTVEREGDEVVIRVRDSGIGIAAEELPRLFQMFIQVDSSIDRSREGLGLGLVLVKKLVELHGGTVSAHSAGLGRGSEFVVRLPVLREAARLAASPRPALVPADAQPAPAGRRRVLIVDDNEDGADSLAMLLQMGGHETHTAHDGLEAVEAAERLRPDAVLLDIGLPKLNGYEVCRRVREQAWGKSMMMIAITGWGQDEDRSQSQAAGFDAHLVKPVDPSALVSLLSRR